MGAGVSGSISSGVVVSCGVVASGVVSSGVVCSVSSGVVSSGVVASGIVSSGVVVCGLLGVQAANSISAASTSETREITFFIKFSLNDICKSIYGYIIAQKQKIVNKRRRKENKKDERSRPFCLINLLWERKYAGCKDR